jgi:hypothetical protein
MVTTMKHVYLVQRCSFDKNHPENVEIQEILGCFNTMSEASECVKAEYKRLYPHGQQLLENPFGDELGAWEGPEEDGSASRMVKMEAKVMELQRHYCDDSRAEKAKEENLLTGSVPQGFTFNFFRDLRRSKTIDFSVGKADCLAAHDFALAGRHDAPFDNIQMEAAIRKYGGRIVSADDFPSESFPKAVIVLSVRNE